MCGHHLLCHPARSRAAFPNSPLGLAQGSGSSARAQTVPTPSCGPICKSPTPSGSSRLAVHLEVVYIGKRSMTRHESNMKTVQIQVLTSWRVYTTHKTPQNFKLDTVLAMALPDKTISIDTIFHVQLFLNVHIVRLCFMGCVSCILPLVLGVPHHGDYDPSADRLLKSY